MAIQNIVCNFANNKQYFMNIKVLGLGCNKCKKTYSLIDKIIKEYNLTATLEKVDDIAEMTKYDCCITPAIVIDERVVIKGYVPKESEIKKILNIK